MPEGEGKRMRIERDGVVLAVSLSVTAWTTPPRLACKSLPDSLSTPFEEEMQEVWIGE